MTMIYAERHSLTNGYTSALRLGSPTGKIVAECRGHRYAEKLAVAYNTHNALVDALAVAECEIQRGGTVDRKLVLHRIAEALKLARVEA